MEKFSKFQIFVIGFAFAAILLIPVDDVFADHAEVSIGAVAESGFSQSCVEAGCYTPSVLTIKSGTIVTMTNTDTTGVHTFTSGTVDEFEPNPDGMFNSQVLMTGDAYERKFSQKGTFDYYCTLHTWMTGQIIVE